MQKSSNKIECTDKMQKRLKELQNEHIPPLKDKDVATLLGIPYDTYKNIKNGKIKYIKLDLFNKFKQIYDCTGDYLNGTSDDKHLLSDGSPMESPILFSEANKKMTDVSNYLHNDYKTLNNLHMIFYRLPTDIRENMINTFNSICDNIKITTLVDRKDELSKDKFEYLINNLNTDDSELTKMNLKLAEADHHLGKKRKKQALGLYLEIIYYSTIGSLPAAKLAASKVIALTEWCNFPEILKPLSNDLPAFINSHGIFDSKLLGNIEKIISTYLKETNPSFVTREAYINSMVIY